MCTPTISVVDASRERELEDVLAKTEEDHDNQIDFLRLMYDNHKAQTAQTLDEIKAQYKAQLDELVRERDFLKEELVKIPWQGFLSPRKDIINPVPNEPTVAEQIIEKKVTDAKKKTLPNFIKKSLPKSPLVRPGPVKPVKK